MESYVISFNKNDVQMEPGRFKWSLIESYVISFNKNDVQMEPGRSKWSLGGPNGA